MTRRRIFHAGRLQWLLSFHSRLALVLVVGALGFVYYQHRQEAATKLAQERAERELLEGKIAKLVADVEELSAKKDAEVDRLLAAKTEQEKAAAQAAIDREDALLRARRKQLQAAQEAAAAAARARAKRRDIRRQSVKCDPNDPLCGIDNK